MVYPLVNLKEHKNLLKNDKRKSRGLPGVTINRIVNGEQGVKFAPQTFQEYRTTGAKRQIEKVDISQVRSLLTKL